MYSWAWELPITHHPSPVFLAQQTRSGQNNNKQQTNPCLRNGSSNGKRKLRASQIPFLETKCGWNQWSLSTSLWYKRRNTRRWTQDLFFPWLLIRKDHCEFEQRKPGGVGTTVIPKWYCWWRRKGQESTGDGKDTLSFLEIVVLRVCSDRMITAWDMLRGPLKNQRVGGGFQSRCCGQDSNRYC